MKKALRASGRLTLLGLLLLWWEAKEGESEPRITWMDGVTLVGLVTFWLFERKKS